MKILLRTMLVIVIGLMSANCNFAQSGEQKETKNSELLDPETFNQKMKDHQIVDVRTPKEFESGFIEGAQNIDFKDSGFKKAIAALEKEKPVYLYCRSGGRSAAAAKMMRKMGFSEVYDLKGGILSWNENGLEIIK